MGGGGRSIGRQTLSLDKHPRRDAVAYLYGVERAAERAFTCWENGAGEREKVPL